MRPSNSKKYRAVGILALTLPIARSLAHELNITKPICISPAGFHKLRGIHLDVLLVTEDLYPLQGPVADALVPALEHKCGYVMEVRRHDPQKGQ
jgi:hypothetical protein